MGEKKKVLIVEDEVITAEHLRSELIEAGYDAIVAYDGENAVEEASRFLPDVVIMDVKLRSSMDGVQAAELIKVRCNVPIIFLTAFLDEQLVNRSKHMRPYMYISKPYDLNELLAAIEIALENYKDDNKLKSIVSDSVEKYIKSVEQDVTNIKEELGFVKNILSRFSNDLSSVKRVIDDYTKKLDSVSMNIGNIISEQFRVFFGDHKDHILDHSYIKECRERSKETYTTITKSAISILVGAFGVIVIMGIIAWIKSNLAK